MLEISLRRRCDLEWLCSRSQNTISSPDLTVPFMIWVKLSLLLQFLFLELSRLGPLSWRTTFPLESLRTLTSRWMKRGIVKEAAGCNPWLWLPARLQELIVGMLMRPRRWQMLTCLYKPKAYQQMPPIETAGTSWLPEDEDTPTHSHMPPVGFIVFTNLWQ